ncbi:predicted protein [Lichtheimia corymbifera JMRC:FSU:9682]|uniref:Uncharacterized protein n=1 Tax=Lichtheimia corymbifera JMRC:FSU:9682 TaxID=1263082 RepID=A0A068S0Q8_9FUNG|nr:predicted protein [Lichtheimia corymbifera JMRC:FSU:9682]
MMASFATAPATSAALESPTPPPIKPREPLARAYFILINNVNNLEIYHKNCNVTICVYYRISLFSLNNRI